MIKKNLHYILLLLILVDIGYSFTQHLNTELDGDMADIILPSHWYQKVLEDPFGLSVLINNEVYCAPNRFFLHWFFSKYFKVVPGLLQNFVTPVDSVYLACAVGKTLIQIFLIMLLAAYISGKKNVFSKEYLLSAMLIAPFFISYEYWRLGIIDGTVTFAFSYALPLGLLLLFFLPFFKKIFYGEEINSNIIYRIYLILLALIVSLNGALIPGVVIITCPTVIINLLYHNFKEPASLPIGERFISSMRKIPKEILFYFTLITVFSLYSLYIGRNNLENTTVEVSLSERYSLLPAGFVFLFSQMTLIIPLIIIIAMNALIIRKYFYNSAGRKILTFLKWIVICSLIYILLLPFGGFRTYRPVILRYDTLLPVTLALLIIFGLSTYFLIFNLSGKFKIMFSSVIIIFLLFYCYQNKSIAGANICQRNALYEISKSQESIVLVSSDCNIMAWKKITDYKESELNADLLELWGVTKGKKLYYQK